MIKCLVFVFIFISCNPTANFKSSSKLPSLKISTLLDIHPDANFAYSLRKLRSEYNGAAIKVRRSSDNQEKDIGFSNGLLNLNQLESFVGSSDGYIVTWYDQSVSANHSTQSDNTIQPLIVSSGVTYKDGGNPAINFNNSSLISSNNVSFNDWTIFIVFNDTSTNTSYERLLDHNYINGFWLGRDTSSANFGGGVKETSPPYGRFQPVANNAKTLLSSKRSNNIHDIWINNDYTNKASGVVDSTSTAANFVAIGSWYNGSTASQRASNIGIFEIIIYPSSNKNDDSISKDLSKFYHLSF